jgi:hypothetical protein
MWWSPKPAQKLEVTVEYHAPHWIVLIRNAGQMEWSALRDPETKISIQDEFGHEIQTRPAIRAFVNVSEAEAWITENLSAASRVGQRTAEEMRAFETRLNAARNINAGLQLAHSNA